MHAGNGGPVIAGAEAVALLRTGDLIITGGNAGQGLNSSYDGQYGPVEFMMDGT